MPDVSIIVPIYKVEDWLARCIESILRQTYSNFELILVDDGSLDFCTQICDSYMKKDNRIKVIHKANGGVSSARNAGLNAAIGDYIAFCDPDDWIEPRMIEAMVGAIQNQDADMVVCNYVNEYESPVGFRVKEEIFRESEDFSGEAGIERLMHCKEEYEYYVVVWNKLYKRTLWNTVRFPVGFVHEEVGIMHEIYLQCNKVSCLSDTFYHYWQRKGSTMNNRSQWNKFDNYAMLARRARFLMDKGFFDYAFEIERLLLWLLLPDMDVLNANKKYMKRICHTVADCLTIAMKDSECSKKMLISAVIYVFSPKVYFKLFQKKIK